MKATSITTLLYQQFSEENPVAAHKHWIFIIPGLALNEHREKEGYFMQLLKVRRV